MLGEKPLVEFEDHGPGELRVRVDSSDDAGDGERELEDGTLARQVPGPVRLLLAPFDGVRADWELKARRSEVLRADLVVEERR